MSARRPRVQRPPTPAAGLGAALPVVGLGAALGGVVCLAWSWARPHGAPAPGILAAGIAIAVVSRCLGLLSGAGVDGTDELPLIGLLLGAGLSVAFVRFGPGSAPAAVLTALAVVAVWWQTGLVANVVRDGLLLDRTDRPTAAADLALETHGAVFGLIALTAAVLLLARVLAPHGGAARVGALAVAVQVGCGALLVA